MDIREAMSILKPIHDLERDMDSNAFFQVLLAQRIQNCGMSAGDLTLNQLRKLCEEAATALNGERSEDQ